MSPIDHNPDNFKTNRVMHSNSHLFAWLPVVQLEEGKGPVEKHLGVLGIVLKGCAVMLNGSMEIICLEPT